ncbi:hypothetical protein GCM10009682_53040 [Luedemannella flava]|uniref:Uncharacterized protein n=1 Tax=Luedemannella flava TaxID=349316 RepID=A0ABN2MHB9_9ACTN
MYICPLAAAVDPPNARVWPHAAAWEAGPERGCRTGWGAGGQQPQEPPQQPPPVAGAGRGVEDPPRVAKDTVERSLTVSAWPAGHVAGAAESAIVRLTSNVSPHARQRNSYLGTVAPPSWT